MSYYLNSAISFKLQNFQNQKKKTHKNDKTNISFTGYEDVHKACS